LTLTLLAIEYFLLHQALTQVHLEISRPDMPGEDGEHPSVPSLDAFVLGFSVMMSSIKECTDGLRLSISVAITSDTARPSLAEVSELQQLGGERR
jgi:hypothetical protein